MMSLEALYDPKRRFKLWKSSLDQGKNGVERIFSGKIG